MRRIAVFRRTPSAPGFFQKIKGGLSHPHSNKVSRFNGHKRKTPPVARITHGKGSTVLGVYVLEHDSLGRVIRSQEQDGSGEILLRTEHLYDAFNRLSRQTWSADGKTYTEYYSYDDATDGSMTLFRTTSGQKTKFTYDALRRLQKTTVTDDSNNELYTVARSYYTSGSKTTTRTEYFNYRMPDGSLIAGDRYTYDALGNITGIYQSQSPFAQKTGYTYDDQNQLLTETRYDKGVTYTYKYDTAGNILSATDGTTTHTYTYGDANWRDLLTAVDGQAISYDQIGNPKNWYNGTTYTGLTWENGRQLTSITTGGKTATYTYDADGIRTYKKVGNAEHEYHILNGKVVYEKLGSGSTAKIMIFSYDAQGRSCCNSGSGVGRRSRPRQSPCCCHSLRLPCPRHRRRSARSPFAVKYSTNNGASFINYFYALNQQGDVVKIFRPMPVKDSDGNLIGRTEKVYATYTYDAWGKLIGITDSNGDSLMNKQATSSALANRNPLRYRGYYYDVESGFYYLQSRYYDPTLKRFLNADSFASTGQSFIGTNMFVYCGNNPITRIDASGLFWEEIADFLSGIFGAGATVEEQESTPPVESVITPFNLLVTAKSGLLFTAQLAEYGDSTKPISVYAKGRADDEALSSAGIKINIAQTTINLSLGLDNIGVSVQHSEGDTQTSYAIKADLPKLEVGVEAAHTKKWNEKISSTHYNFYGITFSGIATALVAVVAYNGNTSLAIQ